jgi:hypothetical protein
LPAFLRLYIHRKYSNSVCNAIFNTFVDRIGKTSKDVKLNFEEWMAVLKLAKKWKLNALNAQASTNSERYFSRKSSVDKILCGKKYNIEKWLKEGCREIGLRTKALTRDEKAQLDLPTYVGLLELRDRVTEWISEDTDAPGIIRRREDFGYDAAFSDIFVSRQRRSPVSRRTGLFSRLSSLIQPPVNAPGGPAAVSVNAPVPPALFNAPVNESATEAG